MWRVQVEYRISTNSLKDKLSLFLIQLLFTYINISSSCTARSYLIMVQLNFD